MDLEEKKIEFLYKGIDDTQQTIRFCDTKTTVVTFVIGIVIAMLGSGVSDFAKYFWGMRAWQQLIFVLSLILCVCSAMVAFYLCIKILYPHSNPSTHIEKRTTTKDIFYCSSIDINLFEVFFNFSEHPKIKPTFEEMIIEYDNIESYDDIRNELIFEHLKLSYIKEMKLRRVKAMKTCLFYFLLTIPFIVFFHFWGLSYYLPIQKP